MLRPDDGLIHAWLDGQLSTDEATRVEQLVATDAAWAEAAAEARGLIAASSRILSALDHAPSGVMPKRPAAPARRRLPWWTKMAAAVVVMAGASTLLLRRAPAPEVVRVTPATKPAELVIVPSAPTVARQTTPAPTPATKQAQSTRKEAADAALAAASAASAASGAAPQATAAPVVAAPAPNLATQSGAVAEQQSKVAVAAEQATRQQVMDQARQRATQVPMQRTAAEPAVAKAFAGRDAAPAPSPNLVGGVAADRRVAFTTSPGACYRLRDSRTSDEVGTVMRIGRLDGDTLRLESLQAASPLRAWVVLRDGTARGVLTTAPDGRGMILVTALPVSCPAP